MNLRSSGQKAYLPKAGLNVMPLPLIRRYGGLGQYIIPIPQKIFVARRSSSIREISKLPESVGAINFVTLHEVAVCNSVVGTQGDIWIALIHMRPRPRRRLPFPSELRSAPGPPVPSVHPSPPEICLFSSFSFPSTSPTTDGQRSRIYPHPKP